MNSESFSSAPKSSEKERLQEVFESEIRGNFDKVSEGNYESPFPGISSISVLRGPGNKVLYVKAWYENEEGKERSAEWSLSESGMFSGKPPRDFPATHEDVKKFVFDLLAGQVGSSWGVLGVDILPGADELESPGPGGNSPSGKKEGIIREPIDPERVQFFENLPVLLRFVSKEGFNNYFGVVMAAKEAGKLLVLIDSQRVGNAAYYFSLNLPEEIPQPLTSDEAKDYIEQHLEGLFQEVETKGELQDRLGAGRVVHFRTREEKGETGRVWKEKLRAIVSAQAA